MLAGLPFFSCLIKLWCCEIVSVSSFCHGISRLWRMIIQFYWWLNYGEIWFFVVCNCFWVDYAFLFYCFSLDVYAYMSCFACVFLVFLCNIYVVGRFFSALQDGLDPENTKQSTTDMTAFVSSILSTHPSVLQYSVIFLY